MKRAYGGLRSEAYEEHGFAASCIDRALHIVHTHREDDQPTTHDDVQQSCQQHVT